MKAYCPECKTIRPIQVNLEKRGVIRQMKRVEVMQKVARCLICESEVDLYSLGPENKKLREGAFKNE